MSLWRAFAPLDAGVRAQSEASAVSATGELDVFITGSVSRAQLEALGVTVRTELPGIFTAFVPETAVDALASLPGVTASSAPPRSS